MVFYTVCVCVRVLSVKRVCAGAWEWGGGVTERDRDTEKERERETERQTDRQTGRQAGRQADRDMRAS